MDEETIFINHHSPRDWRYTNNGIYYIKIGPYEAERCDFEDGKWSVGGREFETLVLAYMTLNKEWLEHERSVK